MAFDGRRNTMANSLFPTHQCQAGVNAGGGNSGNTILPFISIPTASPQEQDPVSYMPWPHTAHDDPYDELINSVQNSIKNRKPSENTDYDEETDLQGLVSNILDEADSQDSFISDGDLSKCNPIWSPNTLKGDLQQYFQSEPKTQHPTFPPNYVSREVFSKAQGQALGKDVEEFCQQSNGLATNQQWLFNLSNGDKENCTPRPQRLPPGLPVHNMGNGYPHTQIQQSKYDNASDSADRDRGTNWPVNNFPDLCDVVRPQSETPSPCFDSYYEDQYVQNGARSTTNEQNVSQDINQMFSSLQSLMTGEHDGLNRRDFPNMNKQAFDMLHEDCMVEQLKLAAPVLSPQSTPAMQTPKQLMGESGMAQRERNGGVGKQAFKPDTFQAPAAFNSQNTEYFRQPEPLSASVKPKNKMSMQRENMNPFPKQHMQQDQNKPQMQREKMMQMSGFLVEGSSTRPPANIQMREGDKKQVLPQVDLQGGMHSQRFNGENNTMSAGYPIFDLRGRRSIPFNSNLNPRSILPNENGGPGMDVCDMSGSDAEAFRSHISDMMKYGGESAYPGMASAMITSVMMNKGRPIIELYVFMEECYEQLKCLEKERKRTEVILSKTFVGKRTAAGQQHIASPKTPPNPTRVDHLIVKQHREQAKVANLLDRMESLRKIPLPVGIHTALNRQQTAISIIQAIRKEEISNISKYQQQQRTLFTENRHIKLLVDALKDLTATTRKLRKSLWCALQLTLPLPRPVKKADHFVDKEATDTQQCSSPFEGYSFRLGF